jgi:hypothetical protein
MTEFLISKPLIIRPRICSAARRSAALFAALVGIASLVSPIHAALAAPSQVSNIDEPGRIPYQSVQAGKAGAQFVFQFPSVPAGHRLVIQHVSGFNLSFQLTPSQHVRVRLFFADGGTAVGTSFFVPFSEQSVAFDQSVQLYAQAGDAPLVTVEADNAKDPTFDGGLVVLTGYLVDCNAAPCAAIAQ